jgi:aspartyl-tRNA(Asn)/glutamyl-tRNA(Gln) amidotransferase subunit C
MTLTIEEVRHIAQLARLRLTPEEEELYRNQLSSILDYAIRLSEVDTSAIPPTATVLSIHAPLREDIARPSRSTKQILANAAVEEEDMFSVPLVINNPS